MADAVTDADDIERYRREHITPGMTAGEFAQLLPEHLRSTYWHQKIEQVVAREPGVTEDDQ